MHYRSRSSAPWLHSLVVAALFFAGTLVQAAPAGDPVEAKLKVAVRGNRLIDANGDVLQLRGVNVSALEFVSVQGWSTDPWGGNKPDLKAIKAWRANALRVPLNSASYLGLTTYDLNGKTRNPDPGGNYKTTVRKLVDEATALGLYVILDLHKQAPKATVKGMKEKVSIAPVSSAQNEMADLDHSLDFWKAIATDYKSYGNVLFGLFNEPHADNFEMPRDVSDPKLAGWKILRDGGTGKIFYGADAVIQQPWQSAGMQAMLDAVRATGATNVVLVAGISWDQDLSHWVAYAPKDPLQQMACEWHAYPKYGAAYGTPEYTQPGLGSVTYDWAEAILAAGYPIVIGETGDQSAAGTKTAPFLDVVLPWADKHQVSVLGWSWNAWNAPSADLIKDASGTPTDGYGARFREWLVKHP